MNQTDLLLKMMEQPEAYSEAEWEAVLGHAECAELYAQLSHLRSAALLKGTDESLTDELVERQWHRVTLQISPRRTSHPARSRFKVAAMIATVLLVSGIAYAALNGRWASYFAQSAPRASVSRPLAPRTSHPESRTLPADTIQEPTERLYDNATLEQILQDMSAHYGVEVEYRSTDVRRVRLFYEWQPAYTLEKVVQMLNSFERFNIALDNGRLIVSQPNTPQP